MVCRTRPDYPKSSHVPLILRCAQRMIAFVIIAKLLGCRKNNFGCRAARPCRRGGGAPEMTIRFLRNNLSGRRAALQAPPRRGAEVVTGSTPDSVVGSQRGRITRAQRSGGSSKER